MVSVTSAPAAVAETGTLVMFSGADHPSTLNFLPETHVVVLPADRVAKTYEDVWDLIRQRMADPGNGLNGMMPRTVEGPEIVGVMGICPKGIDFEAPDGADVHFIILIATPEEHGERHQEVLAAVARIMSDPEIRGRLAIAHNPAEAFDAIEADAKADYNYFLED